MKRDPQLIYLKFHLYLNWFICDSVINFFWCFIVGHNLKIIYYEAIAHATQKKLIGKVTQKGEVIIVWDIRAKVTKKEETEVEKTKKALEWVETAKLKKENIEIATYKKL